MITMSRVEGKVAIVTGAAKGLGEATSRLLFENGAKVVMTDVDTEAGEAAAQAIDSSGDHVIFMKQDVTDESLWKEVIEKATSTFGQLDILVNNAGIGAPASIEDETLEGWRRTIDVNLESVFLGTKYAVEAMKESGGGSIINLSSIMGLVGDASLTAYNASKGGVRLFTKSVALHCAKEGNGVRVNSVHPGYIWTPMVENVTSLGGDSDAATQALVDLHPIGRLGEPMDIAYGILYLASDEAKFVTGSELVIDGGYTAQ